MALQNPPRRSPPRWRRHQILAGKHPHNPRPDTPRPLRKLKLVAAIQSLEFAQITLKKVKFLVIFVTFGGFFVQSGDDLMYFGGKRYGFYAKDASSCKILGVVLKWVNSKVE